MGVFQAECPPRAGGQLPLGKYLGGEAERGLWQQKPLGIQGQFLLTLVPDVTNVLSTGALVVMDGVHPSVSLKREAGARGCGCPVLPGAHLGA